MTRREHPFLRPVARAALVLAILAFAASPAPAGPTPKEVKPGDAAPAFSGASTSGAQVDSRDLLARNRAVLLAFWGIRCAACIEEIPALRKIQEEFREGTLQVIGVNTDGVDAARLKSLMEEERIATNYTILADPDFKVVDAFALTAAPLTVLIGREGKVRYSHYGYKAGDEVSLRAAILDAVK